MEIDHLMPPDLRNLTRLMGTHAEHGNRTRCIQRAEDPNQWTVVTTESPVDAARFARCLMGCEVRIDHDGNYSDISSGENRIRVVRHGFETRAWATGQAG